MNRQQKNQEKGSRNQRRSAVWMQKHPIDYGILDSSRIVIVRAGYGSLDFFSVVYESAKVWQVAGQVQIDPANPNSKTKFIQGGFVEKDLRAGFDIIAMPYPPPIIGTFPEYVTLVQVKSNRQPATKYVDALKNIKVPWFIRKELHIWMDNNKIPIIIKL